MNKLPEVSVIEIPSSKLSFFEEHIVGSIIHVDDNNDVIRDDTYSWTNLGYIMNMMKKLDLCNRHITGDIQVLEDDIYRITGLTQEE